MQLILERCSCRVIWGTSSAEKGGSSGTSSVVAWREKGRVPRAWGSLDWGQGERCLRQAGWDSLSPRRSRQRPGPRMAKLPLQLSAPLQGREEALPPPAALTASSLPWRICGHLQSPGSSHSHLASAHKGKC